MANSRDWSLGNPRLNTEPFSISAKGELVLTTGSKRFVVKDLAKKYGTPLEIFLPEVARSRARRIVDAFAKESRAADYGGTFAYHYPMKANQRKDVLAAVLTGGAHAETSSANELRLLAGIARSKKSRLKILANGPKTEEYLSLAQKLYKEGYQITPIIEDDHERRVLARFAGPVGVRVDLRVATKAHWNKKFNRFGLPEEELLALPKIPHLTTLSYHISSQISSTEGVTDALAHAIKLYAKLQKKNPGLSTINIGGGAGLPYIKKSFYTTEELVRAIVRSAKSEARKAGIKEPNLICEWGQHVVAPSQISIFEIINEKLIKKAKAKKWSVINGSFISNLPDTWSIHQGWHVVPLAGLKSKALEPHWLAGSSCDSDDEYTADGRGVLLPKGDLAGTYLAVFDTGAYQGALASHHCLLPRPTRISIEDGRIHLTRKKQDAKTVGKIFGW